MANSMVNVPPGPAGNRRAHNKCSYNYLAVGAFGNLRKYEK
jgi:hypothetical protein